MFITELIEKFSCKYLYTSVKKDETKSNGKNISGLIKGWHNMSDEELKIINDKRLKDANFNQIWFRCNKNFMVFDADTEESFTLICTFLRKNNLYVNSCITKSFKGVDLFYKRHFWFKLEMTDDLMLFDEGQIKFDGGEIFYGSNCILGEYINSTVEISHMPVLTYDTYNKLSKILNVKNKVEKTEKTEKTEKPKIEKPTNIIKNPTPIIKTDNNKNDDLIKLIDGLNKKRYENYNDWLIFYFIVINENLNIDIFKYFSMKSNKYNEVENNKLLKNVSVKNGYTLSTLYYWLKEDNINLFIELCKTRNDFWDMQLDNYSVAKLYYNLHQEEYIYNLRYGWFEYNDNNILIVRGKYTPPALYNNFSKSMQQYATEQRNLVTNSDEKFYKKQDFFTKFHKLVGSTAFIDSTVKQLMGLYSIDDIDKKLNNKNILSFNNILYDYSTNEYRLIEKTDYITLTCGYDLQYKIVSGKITPIYKDECKLTIENLINSIFENEEINAFWLRTTALSLFGNKHERFYIHSGKGGGNGKGLTQRLILNCLGQYYKCVSNTFLMGSLKKGAPDSELASCVGVRYLSISEPDDSDNKKFNVNNLKTYSGNDIISCRDLNEKTFSYIPQFVIHLAVNDIPKMSKFDGGIERRINIIDYPFEFRDVKTITNTNIQRPINYDLKDKVINNMDIIQTFIIMLIEIAYKYKDVDYETPTKIIENKKIYADENNDISEWFKSIIEVTTDENDYIKVSELMLQYNESPHCAGKKLRPVDFSKLMDKLKINKSTVKRQVVYTHIKYIVFD